jgi:hypothetical protein
MIVSSRATWLILRCSLRYWIVPSLMLGGLKKTHRA